MTTKPPDGDDPNDKKDTEGKPPAKRPQSFDQMLKAHLPEIERALPKHMDANRMARLALTECRKNPRLGECDPRTVFASLIISSQLGLEVGIMGQAFLVPYKSRNGYVCQFIPGWQGLNDLVSRTGRATTWTGAVRAGDEFDYQLGDSPYVRHRPGEDNHDAPLTHFYAIGRVRGSQWPIIEVWPIKKVIAHRDKYNKVGEKHYSHHSFEMYARKVPLLQVIKYLPRSVELSTAIALEHAAERGDQGLNIPDVIEGTWTPAPFDDSNGDTPAAIQQPRSKSAGNGEAKPAAQEQPQDAQSAEKEQSQNGEAPQIDNTPIGENLVPLITAKLAAAEITQAEFFREFQVKDWPELRVSQLEEIFAWIKNPGPRA